MRERHEACNVTIYPRAAVPVRQPFVERDYYSDPRRRARSALVRLLRRPVRRLGFDLEVRSFYSPIPAVEELDEQLWSSRSELRGLEFDLDRQLHHLEHELAPYVGEFKPPRRSNGRTGAYFLDNGLFGAGDAELLYAAIRRHRPRLVLELGAGFSTLVSAAAVRANRAEGHETRLISCDPYASREAAATVDGLAELRPIAAERLDETLFAALGDGDILFIDSSHAVRLGGDVIHLTCEVLPRLAPGVIVHFHDIYLPYPYPRAWYERLGWYWAEQYMLQALLAGSERFDVLIAAHALWRERTERFTATIPTIDPINPPLSFWMRVR
jgi:predicted O-methyltransferase YrrM